MTEATERRGDTTRQRLMAAASRQFADRPYSMVSLDDILEEAELTKGAMYFHFASKQALALAIIDELTEMSRTAIVELRARKMSGLETLIDMVFLRAVQDIQYDVARAALRLIESLDNPTPQPPVLWHARIDFVTTAIRTAIAEGDVNDRHSPEDIAKMMVALWVGIRRTNNLDEPKVYLDNLRNGLILALPGFTNPDRIAYFVKFVQRRHEIAVKKACAEELSFDLHAAASAPSDA